MTPTKFSRINFDNDVVGNNTVTLVNTDDSEYIEEMIWECERLGKYVRLITSAKVKENVLFALSYSDKNLLQIRVNMLDYNNDIIWVCNTAQLSRTCGVFVVVTLDLVVPEIVSIADILYIVNLLKFNKNIYFSIRFSPIMPSKVFEDFLIINSKKVSRTFFTEKGGVFSPTEEYKNKIMEVLKCYGDYSKILIGEYNYNNWNGGNGGER